MKGAGIKDVKDFVVRHLPFLRQHAPPSIRSLVEKMGSTPITHIDVCRTPLAGGVRKFINLITLGGFEAARKRLGYDKIFHLYMLLTFADGKTVRIDKNETVQVNSPADHGGTCLSAGNPGIDLKTFFEKGEAKAGSQNAYWVYNPITANCQKFVMDSLSGCGLITSSLKTFIFQDAAQLVKSEPIRKVLTSVTNIAGRADTVLHGQGNRKKLKVHRRKTTRGGDLWTDWYETNIVGPYYGERGDNRNKLRDPKLYPQDYFPHTATPASTYYNNLKNSGPQLPYATHSDLPTPLEAIGHLL